MGRRVRNWFALLASVCAFAVPAGVVPALAQPASTPPRQVLTSHQVRALNTAQSLGPTDPALQLELAISLPLRNRPELDALLVQQNNPTSPLFHAYLTPDQFLARFAPDQASVDIVTAYLSAQGLQVLDVARNHQLVRARGPVAVVQAAFGVQIDNFVLRGRQVHAPRNTPSLPPAIAQHVLAIHGLDDVGVPEPRLATPTATPALGSGPNGGYVPSELRSAYDAGPLLGSGADGTGQTVAIYELSGYTPSDVDTYLSMFQLGPPRYTNVFVNGATNVPGPGSGEVALDMEVVSAMAPGARQLIYIGADASLTTGLAVYNAVVADNAAHVVTTSWGICELFVTPAYDSTLDNILVQASAQGQAVFAASGDAGAFDCDVPGGFGNTLAVDSPANDPHIIGAGGTRLLLSAGGGYGSEQVWACAPPACNAVHAFGDGGGGGLSTVFPQPGYQNGPGTHGPFANGKREVPDVSADADPNTGYAVFCTVRAACQQPNGTVGWWVFGGTSAAAPLWAAVAADTNQHLFNHGKATLGSGNSAIYAVFQSTQPFPAFHDVTVGNNLFYPATSGYDLATGIGTPDVWNFARDAASLAANVSSVFHGRVQFPGRPAPPSPTWVVPLTLSFLDPTTGNVVASGTPGTDSSGTFFDPGLQPGTYNVRVKSAQSLSKLVRSVVLVLGDNPMLDFGMLAMGDVNNDNVVDLLDFSSLRATFGLCQGAPGYDPRADLNADGCVDLLDFSLLRTSFGQVGQ